MGAALLTFDVNPVLSQNDAMRFLGFGTNLMTIHADSADTDGQFALIEIRSRPGSEPPLHVHYNEDELFLVLEGQLTVRRGSEEFTLQAGQSGFLPRGVAHTFKITSDEARFFAVITPGGFEEYFREIGQALDAQGSVCGPAKPFSPERMLQVAARYNCVLMP